MSQSDSTRDVSGTTLNKCGGLAAFHKSNSNQVEERRTDAPALPGYKGENYLMKQRFLLIDAIELLPGIRGAHQSWIHCCPLLFIFFHLSSFAFSFRQPNVPPAGFRMKLFAGNEFPRQGSSLQWKLPVSFKPLTVFLSFAPPPPPPPLFLFVGDWDGGGVGKVVELCFYSYYNKLRTITSD